MSINSVLFGCSGPALSEDERRFFRAVNPLGFILFARNVENPAQVKALVQSLRDSVGRADAPVLIDQEGGRVRRLRPPHWYDAPPGAAFARLAARDPDLADRVMRLNCRLIGRELADLGIDVDCAPVLDVPVAGAHDVIGDRALGDTPLAIIRLGRASIEGFLDEGIIPVIKHIPGHGRAMVDSHLDLPVVTAGLEDLDAQDFAPFRALAGAPWAMTAHVVYPAIDKDRPATTSPIVINQVIRGRIGFDGLLISDDLSMKALGGRFQDRATQALDAGCDVVLHCNGDAAEMAAIAEAVRPLTPAAHTRIAKARAQRRVPVPFDAAEAAQTVAKALESV